MYRAQHCTVEMIGFHFSHENFVGEKLDLRNNEFAKIFMSSKIKFQNGLFRWNFNFFKYFLFFFPKYHLKLKFELKEVEGI